MSKRANSQPCFILHPSFHVICCVPYPSSFILHPCSDLIPHPLKLIPHPPSYIPHYLSLFPLPPNSSFICQHLSPATCLVMCYCSSRLTPRSSPINPRPLSRILSSYSLVSFSSPSFHPSPLIPRLSPRTSHFVTLTHNMLVSRLGPYSKFSKVLVHDREFE